MSNWVQKRITDTDGQRGAAIFLIVIAMMIMILIGALAIDVSATSNRSQELQNAADSAALAGVQAYRASINTRATESDPNPAPIGADEDAAKAEVDRLLQQNGITGLTPLVTFPDATANSEVRVELRDPDGGGKLFSGFTTGDSELTRSATASFKACSSACARTVGIPSPFTTVNAKGEGDGYKPIAVGDRFYALNHNKNQITCVDRILQEACWCVSSITGMPCGGNMPDWERKRTRYAYAGAEPNNPHPGNSQWNPEMVHSAVFGTTIWWSTSDDEGHHLFCWETVTETPCPTKYTLTTGPRATSNQIDNSKDQNRGGGTILVDAGTTAVHDDRIFVFTDNHQVHCFNPNLLHTCSGYPVSSSLGFDSFPANQPADGNHGSSIDRILHSDGRLYSTLHIKKAVPIDGPYDCSQNLQNPLGKRVIIEEFVSTPTGRWVSADTSNPSSDNRTVRTSSDGNDIKDRWEIIDAGSGNFNVASAVHGKFWDADGTNSYLDQSNNASADDVWSFTDWDPATRTYKIQNVLRGTWIKRDGNRFRTVSGQNNATRFTFNHWQCEVSPAPPQPTSSGTPVLPYAAGTWLDCFDTNNNIPCSSFTPIRIHEDASRFSGRLFFFRDNTGLETGVCSTGFQDEVSDDEFELECTTLDGSLAPYLPSSMTADFEHAIRASLAQYPHAWGDPHWNESQNRLFYPTNHRTSASRVVCWDFDVLNGFCGSEQRYSALGQIEDYGFYSEGNCVYGLGHTARFYAFKASDFDLECTGSSTEAILRPCPCGGLYEWGELKFNIDLSPYDEFNILIEDRDGDVIWPKGWYEGHSGHSLFHHGLVIDLRNEPVDPLALGDDFLVVKVQVENKPGVVIDPNGNGVGQTFEIEYSQTPKLSD